MKLFDYTMRNVAYATGTEGTAGVEGGSDPAKVNSSTETQQPSPQSVAPWGSDLWKLGEGDKASPWYNAIPEDEVRSLMEAKQYKNPAEVALAYHNLNKMTKGTVTVPETDAPKETWDKFYEKMGRPASPDEYKLNFGDGVEPESPMVKFGKELFHEMGLNPKQAQMSTDKWNTFVAEQNAAVAETIRQKNDMELAQLTSSWGEDLERNKTAGQRAVQALGLSVDTISRIEDQLGSAAVIELLAKIGRKSDEGGFSAGPGGGDPNNVSNMSKDQAQAKIAQLQGDAAFNAKYHDKNHPQHNEALKLMEALYAKT